MKNTIILALFLLGFGATFAQTAGVPLNPPLLPIDKNIWVLGLAFVIFSIGLVYNLTRKKITL